MDRSKERSVIVTGAGPGIGAAAARRFAQEGAKAVLAGRTVERHEGLAADLEGAPMVVADIGTEEGAAAIVGAAMALGGIDPLVSNAGIAGGGEIDKMPPEDWQKQFQTNVFGSCLLLRATWLHLKAERGNVVNTSASGPAGDWKMLACNASKGAVSNFTRALAPDGTEYGIRVDAMNPILTRSELTEDKMSDEDLFARFHERMPLGAPADPEDIAAVIAFLVTGVNLPADDGCMASSGQPPQKGFQPPYDRRADRRPDWGRYSGRLTD